MSIAILKKKTKETCCVSSGGSFVINGVYRKNRYIGASGNIIQDLSCCTENDKALQPSVLNTKGMLQKKYNNSYTRTPGTPNPSVCANTSMDTMSQSDYIKQLKDLCNIDCVKIDSVYENPDGEVDVEVTVDVDENGTEEQENVTVDFSISNVIKPPNSLPPTVI